MMTQICLFWQKFSFSYMPITLEILHTCISLHTTMPYAVFGIVSNIYTWQPYLFFHNDDDIDMPCLAKIWVFSYMPITFEIVHTCMSLYNAMAAYAVFIDSHKYFTLAAIFVQM